MDHLRLVLMMILAAPVKAPVAGGDSTLQLLTFAATFVSQIKVGGFAAWIIEELKQSKLPALSWISTNTPWVTRMVALGAATLTHLGITWTFSGSTLVITGISLAAVVTTVYNIATSYLLQHFAWKIGFATPRPVTLAAPAPGQP